MSSFWVMTPSLFFSFSGISCNIYEVIPSLFCKNPEDMLKSYVLALKWWKQNEKIFLLSKVIVIFPKPLQKQEFTKNSKYLLTSSKNKWCYRNFFFYQNFPFMLKHICGKFHDHSISGFWDIQGRGAQSEAPALWSPKKPSLNRVKIMTKIVNFTPKLPCLLQKWIFLKDESSVNFNCLLFSNFMQKIKKK